MTTKYRERYLEDIVEHGRQGYTLKSFCTIARVSPATLRKWRKDKPDFDDACHVSEGLSSLFYQDLIRQKAIGGNLDAMKTMIKATDKVDFGDRAAQENEGGGKVVYQIDFGDMQNLLEQSKKDDIIVTKENYHVNQKPPSESVEI